MVISSLETAQVRLGLERRGPSDAPVVVLVHGFPDHRGVWGPVVERLAVDHHVVTYDVRGAGDSEAPDRRSGYRVGRLVDDLAAVLEEVAPSGDPVHLVGHDWGSVQLWGALARECADERLSGRIASFTSISGPSLEQYGHFVRRGIRRGRVLTVGRQLARSWYVAAFCLPRLPELVLSRGAEQVRATLADREGLEHDHWGPGFVRDAVNGVNLYRANLLRLAGRPAHTAVPVQLIVPTRDRYVSPALFEDLDRFTSRLRRVEVVGGHWLPQTQPDVVADAVRSFVADLRPAHATSA